MKFDHKQLAKVRKESGLSTEKVARALTVLGAPVSYGTVRNWEAGRQIPDANEIVFISALFKKDVSFFYRQDKAKKVAAVILLALSLTGSAHATVKMEAIKQIESGGNPKAYNKRSGARGLYQITPICLAHYNDENLRNFSMDDMFDPEKNERVATWYFAWLERQDLDDVEQIIAYNWGIGNLKKYKRDSEKPQECVPYLEPDGSVSSVCPKVVELPKETQDYLTKYQCLMAGDCK